jgi:DNA-binding NarL/FixJ family response regulator
MTPIRVLLADDHSLVRAGIRSLLQPLEGIEIVAEAEDGREALRLVETHRPDLVLMDIAMKGLSGLEAAARVTKEFPKVRVIILSMHASEEYVIQALYAGAVGYLLKDSGTAELELAIRAVARGESYLTPAVSKGVIRDYLRRVGGEIGTSVSVNSPYEKLTPRQREILQLIAEGQTTQKMASILSVSIKTVETHRAQLMRRLDLHDVAGLVRYAVRMGLVDPDD